VNFNTNKGTKHPHLPPDPPKPPPPPEPPPGLQQQSPNNPTSHTGTKGKVNLPPDPQQPLPPPEPPPSVNRNSGRNGNLDAWTSQPQDGQPEQDQIRDEVEEREANLQHHFADLLTREKPEGHIRITAGNIGFLPQPAQAAKSRHFIDSLKNFNTDIHLGTEPNIQWSELDAENQWYQRSKETLNRQSYKFGFNRNDHTNSRARQIGGTFVVALQEGQPRVFEKGEDTTKLGRWTWMRIQGRHGHFTRVISAYRPNKNTTDPGSAYNQQQRYWRNDQGIFTCPLKLFDEQLKELLQEWLHAGDHIVLGIDCNEDARSGAIAKMLRCLGMKDAILGLHSKSDPPETCNKNHNRRPIDGIFVTSGIKPTAGGYSSYGQMMDSDHRTLWIDIPFTSFLGHNPPNRPNRQPRRLRGKDPRTTEK
jgi:hypothetical protein